MKFYMLLCKRRGDANCCVDHVVRRWEVQWLLSDRWLFRWLGGADVKPCFAESVSVSWLKSWRRLVISVASLTIRTPAVTSVGCSRRCCRTLG
jgi:hypothetical protein